MQGMVSKRTGKYDEEPLVLRELPEDSEILTRDFSRDGRGRRAMDAYYAQERFESWRLRVGLGLLAAVGVYAVYAWLSAGG